MTADQSTSEAMIYWRYISSTLDRLMTLALEIDDEGLRWEPPAPQTNSIAALASHTLTNAEENILQTLCGQPGLADGARGFTRQADSETLRSRWDDLRPQLGDGLSRLPPEALNEDRNHPRRGTITGREVLLVVARHAAEHLGQAELTRDLWSAQRTP